MSVLQNGPQKRPDNGLFGCLTSTRRRRILAILIERGEPLTERELARRLAAREEAPDEESREAIQRIRTDLRHVHLPKLVECDLVAWDEASATVTATDRPAFEDGKFRALLGTDAAWADDLLDALDDGRRRAIVSLLRSRDEPMARDDLARELAERDPAAADAETLRIRLHHVHLPKLDDAGLIEYDRDGETVASRERSDREEIVAYLLD